MAYTTPKTDWSSTDYFNIEDYARIVGNIGYLHTLAVKIYPSFDLETMTASKTYSSMIYAEDFNKIEDNIATINENTYNLELGSKKNFVDNGLTINYVELNRLESAILRLYKTLTAEYDSLTRLPFTLGGFKGFRV